MKSPITDLILLEAFHGFQRDINNGDGLFCRKPYQRLMKRTKMPKSVCLEACDRAVKHGLINAPDVVSCNTLYSLARTDTLLTTKGRRILGLHSEAPLAHSSKPVGPELLIKGWQWKP